MLTFECKYKENHLKTACSEFTKIQLVADNEVCQGWDMKRFGYNYINITKYHNGEYRYSIHDDRGYATDNFICRFDGNMITITSAYVNKRNLKADKFLEKYAQTAMRVFALVKCGMIN